MFKKESFVFVSLALGVIAAFTGLALVSRGITEGWIAVAIAAPLLFLAQRSMRLGHVARTELGGGVDDTEAPK